MATVNNDKFMEENIKFGRLQKEFFQKEENDPKYEGINMDVLLEMIESVKFREDFPGLSFVDQFEKAIRLIDAGEHVNFRPFRKLNFENDYEFSRKQWERDEEWRRQYREMEEARERAEEAERVERINCRVW